MKAAPISLKHIPSTTGKPDSRQEKHVIDQVIRPVGPSTNAGQGRRHPIWGP
jgi:hypothetical protein